MPERRKVRIDRAVRLIADGEDYSFLESNPSWKGLPQNENEKDKKSIDGYVRMFSNAKPKSSGTGLSDY
jgi:hypothetical protein